MSDVKELPKALRRNDTTRRVYAALRRDGEPMTIAELADFVFRRGFRGNNIDHQRSAMRRSVARLVEHGFVEPAGVTYSNARTYRLTEEARNG